MVNSGFGSMDVELHSKRAPYRRLSPVYSMYIATLYVRFMGRRSYF